MYSSSGYAGNCLLLIGKCLASNSQNKIILCVFPVPHLILKGQKNPLLPSAPNADISPSTSEVRLSDQDVQELKPPCTFFLSLFSDVKCSS